MCQWLDRLTRLRAVTLMTGASCIHLLPAQLTFLRLDNCHGSLEVRPRPPSQTLSVARQMTPEVAKSPRTIREHHRPVFPACFIGAHTCLRLPPDASSFCLCRSRAMRV